MATKVGSKNRISENGHGEGYDPLVGNLDVAAEMAGQKKEQITVKPLNLRILEVIAVGTAPLMQLRFSAKAIGKMMEVHKAGGQAKSKKNREARDFEDDYRQAFHRLADGSAGVPAAAIRAACISACRTINFKMTLAKLSIFCLADGLDVVDGAPLVKLYGKPEQTILPVRNANGSADLRVRPMWREWAAKIRMRFDNDQFSAGDTFNLLARAGAQVGVGEGRPDSRESAGLGYGTFRLLLPDDAAGDEEYQRVMKEGSKSS